MKAAVEQAVADLRQGLPDHEIRVKEDVDGGAYIIVDGVDIGENFEPAESWIGFQITWACPDPDVYPHFIDPAIRYIGKGAAPNLHPDGNLPTAMGRGAVMPGFDLASIQVSRRSTHRNAETDSPLQKLLRIIDFLKSR